MEKLINDFKICFTKGDTYALAVKFKDITEDLSKAQFTVKENPDDVPLIQKALGTGISKIDDRAYKAEKTYKVQIQANDTVFLEAGVQYLYDLQVTIGNVVKTVLSGVFVVNHSVSGVSSATTSALEVSAIDEVETEFATTPATVGLEYESDPVALAKIGNLASLLTDVKSTVVGAINETSLRVEEIYNTVDSILYDDLEVGIARRATKADHADRATHADEADNAVMADYAHDAGHADSATTATSVETLGTTPCNNIVIEGGSYVVKIPSGATGLYFVRFRYDADGIDNSGFIYIGDTNEDAMGAVIGQVNSTSTYDNLGVIGTSRLAYSQSRGGIVAIRMLAQSAPFDYIYGVSEVLILSAHRINLAL